MILYLSSSIILSPKYINCFVWSDAALALSIIQDKEKSFFLYYYKIYYLEDSL